MALKLNPSSGWWYADFSVNGQRKSVNLRVRVEGVRPPGLKFRGDEAFERSRVLAQRAHDVLREAFVEERQRARVVEVLRLEGGGGKIGVLELPGFARRILRREERSDQHVREVVRLVEGFVGGLPAGLRADQVSGTMVRKWWEALSGSARTRNHKRAKLGWLFRRLVEEGLVEGNPVEGLRPARVREELLREPFSAGELERLVEVAEPWFRPVVVVGFTTALRLGDCLRLAWEDLDLLGGWVRVRTNKTGAVVEIPLADRLRGVLPKVGGRGPVWPRLAALRVYEASKVFRKVRVEAGIVGRKDFHSLRLTWITEALSAGVPEEVVRLVSGHSAVEVVRRHYLRPGREQMRRAFEALPVHLRGEKSPLRERALALLEGVGEERLGILIGFLEGLLNGEADPRLAGDAAGFGAARGGVKKLRRHV